MRLVRRAGAALLLVALGRLLSPAAVPVYDGLGAPDEPYRYVAPPAGAPRTAAPTTGTASSPVAGGLSSLGMSLTSAETGPQVSVFLPAKALAAPAADHIVVTATPLAPTDEPPGARIDGNVYDVRFSATGPVTLTAQASFAQIMLRATTPRQPGPVMEHRAGTSGPWAQVPSFRGGNDVYVATFRAPGEYALAFLDRARPAKGGGGTAYLLLGGVLVLVAVVVVVRLRASG